MNEPRILTSLELGNQSLGSKKSRKSLRIMLEFPQLSLLRPQLMYHHHLGFSDPEPSVQRHDATARHAFFVVGSEVPGPPIRCLYWSNFLGVYPTRETPGG